MSRFSKKDVQILLKNYGALPKKRFGQNFLIDKKVLRKIIRAASLQSKDTIIEIGPGTGILTQELAKKVKKIIAVEKDKKMVDILEKTTRTLENVKIIQGDILKLTIKNYALKTKNYKVVANLPYYIVSPVIRKFLENNNPPSLMTLMVQKEVAQRIVAKPPNMNLLAISVQFYAKAKIISYVSRQSFWPKPEVDGAILKINNIRIRFNQHKRSIFFKIVKAGFSQPRKQLINNFTKVLKINSREIRDWLLKNKIQPQRRAETLSIQDWLNLIKTFDFK